MATLIKNGTLITASETFDADILIENEKISLIGKDLQHPNADVIDATGKLISCVGRQFAKCFVDAARFFEVRRAQRAQSPRIELQLGPQAIDGPGHRQHGRVVPLRRRLPA